uniref:Uncharacterized protein n=1 Tax=Globisporangium ultimum (strain ATCC 200006 / CBS 805.95 / DAOM BR144) TaxID=431595 RepID=K3WU86_GLOUD
MCPSSAAPLSSLATLATAAISRTTSTIKTTLATTIEDDGLHHHHHHYHHHHHHYHPHPYLPYRKTSSCTDDDDSVFEYLEDDEQQLQQEKPQFHPQHHHRLIVPTRTATSSRLLSNMPRRKETKKIQIDIPSSQASAGITGDPHQVFKCNGSPIISPRSIRNSLVETDFDLEGNPRPQKHANTASDANSNNRLVVGPALPPPSKPSPTATNGGNATSKSMRRKNRRRPIPTNGATQLQEEDDNAFTSTEDAADVHGAQQEMDLLALKEEEQKLAVGLTGVQSWVHRLLYTHHQTLHVLGLERKDFPNTRLSMKQLETMLSPVISLANMMAPEHFGIHVPTPQIAQTMNDVHYWKLWESDTIDIGIFFMPPNAHIPLHNHPGMSVVTRVLYGAVNVRSYDLISPQEITNGDSEDSTVGSESTDIVNSNAKVKWARVSREGSYVAESTMWLDPRRFNLHQIHAATDNGCALLDIMIPPYNNADRDCHHFKIIEEKYTKDKNERIVKMVESITTDHHNEPSDTTSNSGEASMTSSSSPPSSSPPSSSPPSSS